MGMVKNFQYNIKKLYLSVLAVHCQTQFVAVTTNIAGKIYLFSCVFLNDNIFLNLSPNGYTCDTKAGRCNKGELSIPFYLKTESKPMLNENEPNGI